MERQSSIPLPARLDMNTRNSVINTISRAVFAFGLAAGVAPSILWLQEKIAGNFAADPEHALFWLGLQSVILTTLFGVVLRFPVLSALGGFVGQVLYILSDSGVEYPGSAAMALVLYGLLPASVTAASVTFILRLVQPKNQMKPNAEKK